MDILLYILEVVYTKTAPGPADYGILLLSMIISYSL